MQSYEELFGTYRDVFYYNITRVSDEPSEFDRPALSYYSSRRLQETTLPCPNATRIRLQIEIAYTGSLDVGKLFGLFDSLSTQTISTVCEARIDFAEDPISPPPSPPPFPPDLSEADDDGSMLVVGAVVAAIASCCCFGVAAIVVMRRKKKEDDEPEGQRLIKESKGNVNAACHPLLGPARTRQKSRWAAEAGWAKPLSFSRPI